MKPASAPEESMRIWTEHTEHYRSELLKALDVYERQDDVIERVKDTELFYRVLYFAAFEMLFKGEFLVSVYPADFLDYPHVETMENVLSFLEAAADKLDILN